MFRKLALALGTTVVIAAAALSPTAASAHWHGHWGHGYGIGIGFVPTYIAASDCYTVKKQVLLSDGTLRWRRFTVCN
jgi:hypothetical protein